MINRSIIERITPFVEQKTILVASRLFHKSGWLTSSKLYRDNLMILHNKRLWPSKCRESLNPAAHLTFCTMDCLFTSIFYKRRNDSKRPRCLCRINWSITRSRRRSIVKLDLLKSHTHSPPPPHLSINKNRNYYATKIYIAIKLCGMVCLIFNPTEFISFVYDLWPPAAAQACYCLRCHHHSSNDLFTSYPTITLSNLPAFCFRHINTYIRCVQSV